MKIRRVTYQESRTINVGNYNSIRVEFGLEAELDDGENLPKVQTQIKSIVRDTIETEVGELLESRTSARKG